MWKLKTKLKKNVMNKRDKTIRHLREILDVFFMCAQHGRKLVGESPIRGVDSANR